MAVFSKTLREILTVDFSAWHYQWIFSFGRNPASQAKLTASICYEDWFRKCSKISAILVNTSKSAKNKVFLTLLVFDKNLTNPGKMKSNKTDLGNLNFEKVNFDREMLKKTTFTC